MAKKTPQTAHDGIYLITRCWQRYEAEQAGWYQIFGAGGCWDVYLEDEQLTPRGNRPVYVGQMLVRVQLQPHWDPQAAAQRVVILSRFELLEPIDLCIDRDELYP